MSIQKNLSGDARSHVDDFELHVFSHIKDFVRSKSSPRYHSKRARLRRWMRLLTIDAHRPPPNNMGANPPLPPHNFSHGEKLAVSVVEQKTKIDWLAYTADVELDQIKLGICVFWQFAEFTPRSGGTKGYAHSIQITVDSVPYGIIGHHGVDSSGNRKPGRIWVSLTGVACKTLTDELLEVGIEMLRALDARLTRVDICLDFYRGEQTWDHAKWVYENTNKFCSPVGGKKPPCNVHGGLDSDGRNTGRTLEVGTRGQSRNFLRIYEKGLEVFAKMPEALRVKSLERMIAYESDDKALADDWLRVEAEITYQDKRVLPYEILMQRDQYFAGVNAYTAECLGLADGLRPAAIKTDLQVDLLKQIFHGRRSYGPLIHSLKQLHVPNDEIVQLLLGDNHSSKLVTSGLLAEIKRIQAEILQADPDFDIPF